MFTKIKNDSCFHYETHIGKNRKEKEKQINTLACHVGWQAQTGGQLLRRCASRARKLTVCLVEGWGEVGWVGPVPTTIWMESEVGWVGPRSKYSREMRVGSVR